MERKERMQQLMFGECLRVRVGSFHQYINERFVSWLNKNITLETYLWANKLILKKQHHKMIISLFFNLFF